MEKCRSAIFEYRLEKCMYFSTHIICLLYGQNATWYFVFQVLGNSSFISHTPPE